MCLTPITIPNPNFGGLEHSRKFGKKLPNGHYINEYKNTTTSGMQVNCGHCEECIRAHQMEVAQRLQMEAKGNHLFFCTLTYNNEMIPQITTSQNWKIRYAKWADLQNMIKRIRKDNKLGRDIRYLAVSERGSERGRPHFHIIWIVPKEKTDDLYTPINLEKKLWKIVLDEWRRNEGSRRAPIYKNLCTYKERWKNGKQYRNYDLHYIVGTVGNDGIAAVAFYTTKYMMKKGDHDLKLKQALELNYEPEEARKIWQEVKSRYKGSENLGLDPTYEKTGKGRWNREVKYNAEVVKQLKKGISQSDDYAQFFNTDGMGMPLARYYQKKEGILDLDEWIRIKTNQKEKDTGKQGDLLIERKTEGKGQLERKIREYAKKVQHVTERGDIDNYGYLFDD